MKESQSNDSSASPILPFLRWAGGKRFLAARFAEIAPRDIANRRYFEPFLGSGSLFFRFRPKTAFLADANEHLIHCYKSVRERPDLVRRYLSHHIREDCESYYYHARETYNARAFSLSQAARFIYLNRTCFNGIFRVNKQGEFNVPYGFKDSPVFPAHHELRRVSRVLKRASLRAVSFEKAVSCARSGDFVYLDPPYPPLNGTSFFTHYTADRFGEDDQEQVACVAKELSARGCLVMVSNADTPKIRSLYKGFTVRTVEAVRYITCKKKKHRVSELIITNYK